MLLKLFAKDAVIYALGNIGLRAASLLLTPIYTYWLTLNDFGLWATLQVTIQVLLVLMSLGMRETTVRFTVAGEHERRVKYVLGTSMVLVVMGGAVMTLLVLTVLAPMFRAILHRPDVRELSFLTCCAALTQALSIHMLSYYRARNQSARYMGWGLAGAVILFVTSAAALCLFHMGIRGVLLAYTLTYLGIFVVVATDILSGTGFGFSLTTSRDLLVFGLPLVLSATGQFVIGGSSIFFLSYFAGLETVAIYSLGYKLTSLLSIVVFLPFQLAFQPFLYANLREPQVKDNAARLLTYLITATTVAAFGLVLGSRLLLPWIAPPQYADALFVIILLLPGQAFIGIHYFGETLIGAVKRTYLSAALNGTCAVACLVLNLALIPLFGWYGAAASSNISAIVIDCIEVAIGLRLFQLASHMEWRRIRLAGSAFVGLLVTASLLRAAPTYLFTSIVSLYFLMALYFLYKGPFCTNEEKFVLKTAAQRLSSLLTARAVTR